MGSDKLYTIDSENVSHNEFDGEVVVIHFPSGCYFSLRGTAAVLWKFLERGPASANALLAAFVEAPSEAACQVVDFCQGLHERGVLCESSEGDSESTGPPDRDGVQQVCEYSKPEYEAFEDLQNLLIADVIHDTDEQGWPHIAPDHAA